MVSSDELDPDFWAPGTVRLEDIQKAKGKDIILQPQPTDDPNDPLNWTKPLKLYNFALTCLYVVMVFTLIGVTTATWGIMNATLPGFTWSILNDGYASGCAGLTVGSFLLIPFALKYGRRPIYILSSIIQFFVAIWSAKIQTPGDYIGTNIVGCGVGTLAEVIVQMTVADVFFVHERGTMNTIYVWVMAIGTSLSTVAAGYVASSQGWRWVWWWCAIILGVVVCLFVFTYEETKFVYPARPEVGETMTVLDTGAEQETKRDPDMKDLAIVESIQKTRIIEEGRTTVVLNTSIPRKTYLQRLPLFTPSTGSWKDLLAHSYQPLVILFTIPTVFYMALIYAVISAWSTIMITILSSTMPLLPYTFTSSQIGLMALPGFIGTSLGVFLTGLLSDHSILYLSRRNRGIYEPEFRLYLIPIFAPFVPAGAILYGCALERGWSWVAVAGGYMMCSFGGAPVSAVSLTYVTDSYSEIIGPSLVAVTFTRNLVATILVFALTPWIEEMGIQNCVITISAIGTFILAFVVLFIWKGKMFRIWTRERYSRLAEGKRDVDVGRV
ncbi:serine/threonine kinase 16 [Cadophora sp. DSE1049]|nr:serine/threonine kinase 16 [Cadophora sp. DSE1049]